MTEPVWTPDILRSQQLNKRDSSYWHKHFKELVSDFTNRSGFADKADAEHEAIGKALAVFQWVCDARNRTSVPNSKDV